MCFGNRINCVESRTGNADVSLAVSPRPLDEQNGKLPSLSVVEWLGVGLPATGGCRRRRSSLLLPLTMLPRWHIQLCTKHFIAKTFDQFSTAYFKIQIIKSNRQRQQWLVEWQLHFQCDGESRAMAYIMQSNDVLMSLECDFMRSYAILRRKATHTTKQKSHKIWNKQTNASRIEL